MRLCHLLAVVAMAGLLLASGCCRNRCCDRRPLLPRPAMRPASCDPCCTPCCDPCLGH